MGTNCVHLAYLFYERDFMLTLSGNNQADAIEAINSNSRYRGD